VGGEGLGSEDRVTGVAAPGSRGARDSRREGVVARRSRSARDSRRGATGEGVKLRGAGGNLRI